MEEDKEKCKPAKSSGSGAACSSALWFAGWLFTIAFIKLSFWKAVLAILIWPWYLGNALHSFLPQ